VSRAPVSLTRVITPASPDPGCFGGTGHSETYLSLPADRATIPFMTLVVGRVLNSGVFLLADSLVTYREARYRPAPGSVLKIIVLAPDLCVAFAGDVDRAQLAIEGWSQTMGLQMTAEHFLHAHREGGLDNPDFIIGVHGPTPQLLRIRDGDIERELSTAWIGNAEAFRELQRRFLDRNEADPAISVESAFHEIVSEQTFDDVGDFMIRCRSAPGGFWYPPSSGVRFWPEQVTKGQGWQPISARTAAQGGYAWSLLTPREIGVGAVGLHFQQGRFGCLLFPRYSERAVRVPDVDVRDFIVDIKARFGITLWGMPGFAV
jgi:hypothetical protein